MINNILEALAVCLNRKCHLLAYPSNIEANNNLWEKTTLVIIILKLTGRYTEGIMSLPTNNRQNTELAYKQIITGGVCNPTSV